MNNLQKLIRNIIFRLNYQKNIKEIEILIYKLKISIQKEEEDNMQENHKQKSKREVQKIVKYYENQLPNKDELVMIQVISCEQNGSYVQLLEYQRKKAMVPFTQYTKSMKKNLERAMKIGRVEVGRVIKVDANKGYIDLSKNMVSPQDQNQCEQKYAKTKALHSIVINISKDQNQVNQIYKNYIWPLYKNNPNNHPHDLIKQILVKQEKAEEFGFKDPQIKEDLINELKRRYKRPIVKSIAIFRVSVVKLFDGILKLKQILKSGVEAAKQKNFQVKISILGAPEYLAEILTATKQQGEQALMIALNRIKQHSQKQKGDFQIRQKPKVVGDSGNQINEIVMALDKEDQINDEDQMDDDDV